MSLPANFSFGASAYPAATPATTPPMSPPATPPGAPTATAAPGGFDMNALLQMLQQQMQQQGQQAGDRTGLARSLMFGNHAGAGGGTVNPGNPTGNPADPWSATGLFHGGLTAQMNPADVARSQGPTAVNQWNNPSMFGSQAWRGAPPTSTGVVTNPGAPMSMRGMQGETYDPRFDKAGGTSGIASMYDPALNVPGGRRNVPNSRINSMFGRVQ